MPNDDVTRDNAPHDDNRRDFLGAMSAAGIACSAVAAAVCYFIGTYGCSPGADYICSEFGYC